MDIYREIKQAYLTWGRPEKLYIDFTGGTKAMSVAAAMAAAMVDVQMVYIGTDQYLPDFRKPYPGSECLYYIENPLTVFGDLEVERAMVLFDKANFSGAREKLEILNGLYVSKMDYGNIKFGRPISSFTMGGNR